MFDDENNDDDNKKNNDGQAIIARHSSIICVGLRFKLIFVRNRKVNIYSFIQQQIIVRVILFRKRFCNKNVMIKKY